MTTLANTRVPVGDYALDPTHARASFSVPHMTIARMGGQLIGFEAQISVSDNGKAELTASAPTNGLRTGIDQLDEHLQSPDFFDAQLHPTLRLQVADLPLAGSFEVEGQLALKGRTQAVLVRGEFGGVIEDPYGNTRLGLRLTTEINRHDFGVSWSAPLPGGGAIVGDVVRIEADLELISA